MYGAATIMMVSFGNGVHEFTLDVREVRDVISLSNMLGRATGVINHKFR